MIRINLIQTTVAKEAKRPEASREAARRAAMVAAISAAVCFGAVGLLYWVGTHSIAELNRNIAAARLEAARLAGIEAQNRRFQAQLGQIERHIELIQALESDRTGPQELMADIGNLVDRVKGLYLLSVKSDATRLNIEGQADHVSAIADFIGFLQSTRSFQDIELNRVFEDDQNSTVSFKFGLACLYKPPVETAASTHPVAPAGNSGRSPGR